MRQADKSRKKQPAFADGDRYSRLVIKLGTNLITGGTRQLDRARMADLVDQVAQLHREGREVILVSSGAIAAGRSRLGQDRDRKDIPFRQVMAAVGQYCLMQTYERLFDNHGIVVAQALLTKQDLTDRAGYLNARNTLLSLLYLRVLPIINENDVVATDEIKEAKFGDNDNLSAMVANLVDADLLILLSDVGGLYTSDPSVDPEARLLPRVGKIDFRIEEMAKGPGSTRGTGGMATKIQAAKVATKSGVAVAIADGTLPNVLIRLVEHESIGTLFLPAATKLESRKRWMVSRLASKGKIVVDDGAAAALRGRGSLLAAGIQSVEKKFGRGDLVDLVDLQGNRIACGIANYSSEDIKSIKGAHSDEIMLRLGFEYGAEVVHRNNLVLL